MTMKMERNKLLIFIVTLLCLLVGLGACSGIETENHESGEVGSICITLAGDAVSTKAVTDNLAGETNIKDVQVLIFKSDDGALYRKVDLGTGSGGTLSAEITNVNVGSYTVAAYVNGLAAGSNLKSIKTLDALQKTGVALSFNKPGSDGSFIMYGEKSGVTVTKGAQAAAKVDVTRLVSRIRLLSVKNGIPAAYGKLTVNRVCVINGKGMWKLNNGSPSANFAWAGRKWNKSESTDAADFITAAADMTYTTGSTTYQFGELTFAEKGVEIANAATNTAGFGDAFYVFPNSTASDVGKASFQGPLAYSSAACTRLMLTATVNGTAYYYPVTVPAMKRNESYDVSLTISGFGSTDPNKEPEKGSIKVTVTVNPWSGGQEINADL